MSVLNLLLNAHKNELKWRKHIHYNIWDNDQLVFS